MLKRKYRLLGKVHLENRVTRRTPFFTVHIGINNLLYNRYRFVISKKVDKRATVRNSLKRRISSCIEEMEKEKKGGRDFIFLFRKEAVSQPTSVLYPEIQKVFKEERIL